MSSLATPGGRWTRVVLDSARLLRFVDGLIVDGVAIAGLHLDVEPWGLDEWSSSKSALLDGYLRFVAWTERSRGHAGFFGAADV